VIKGLYARSARLQRKNEAAARLNGMARGPFERLPARRAVQQNGLVPRIFGDPAPHLTGEFLPLPNEVAGLIFGHDAGSFFLKNRQNYFRIRSVRIGLPEGYFEKRICHSIKFRRYPGLDLFRELDLVRRAGHCLNRTLNRHSPSEQVEVVATEAAPVRLKEPQKSFLNAVSDAHYSKINRSAVWAMGRKTGLGLSQQTNRLSFRVRPGLARPQFVQGEWRNSHGDPYAEQ
jgi:hypothetical protein